MAFLATRFSLLAGVGGFLALEDDSAGPGVGTILWGGEKFEIGNLRFEIAAEAKTLAEAKK
jgi:hypothetical protein